MKILVDLPPIYNKLLEVLPAIEKKKGILYCWGDTIYNPDNVNISEPIMLHEEVHCKQQGHNIDEWWERFMIDALFRYEQEVVAHQVEYQEYCRLHKDRNQRMGYLLKISTRLASPMYGSICTVRECMDRIRSKV